MTTRDRNMTKNRNVKHRWRSSSWRHCRHKRSLDVWRVLPPRLCSRQTFHCGWPNECSHWRTADAVFNYDVVIVNGGLGQQRMTWVRPPCCSSVRAEISHVPWMARPGMEEMFAGRGMPDAGQQPFKMLSLVASKFPRSSITQSAQHVASSWKINDATFYFFTPGVSGVNSNAWWRLKFFPDLSRAYPQVVASECSRLFTFGLSAESGISDVLDQLKLPEGYELGLSLLSAVHWG